MLKPLNDWVVVEKSEAPDETKGGIKLPDSHKRFYREGRVLAVGIGRLHKKTGDRIPMQVQVGDRVIYNTYKGMMMHDFEFEGKVIRDCLFMPESEIDAVLGEDTRSDSFNRHNNPVE